VDGGAGAVIAARPAHDDVAGEHPVVGKSTVANLAEKKLHEQGFHTYMLDGDNIRPQQLVVLSALSTVAGGSRS